MSALRLTLMRLTLIRGTTLTVALLLAACATPAPPPPPPRPILWPVTMVTAIHAAGEREQSVIAVKPLADPGISAWQQAAQADVQAGHYAAAASLLNQAMQRSPDSPELLQDRAEVAIYQGDYPLARQLAQRSWTLGPKLGPLCARNWETIAQLRRAADDAAGVATAQKWVASCHKPGVPRF